MAAERTVTATPALGWRQTVTFGPDGRRIIEAAFHMDVDASPFMINRALDKVSRCIDRQVAYYDLIDARLQVEALAVKIRAAEAEAVAIQARSEAAWDARPDRRGEWNAGRMEVAEKQALAGAEASITRDRANYEFWTKRVAELEEVVAQDAAELVSDHNPGDAKG